MKFVSAFFMQFLFMISLPAEKIFTPTENVFVIGIAGGTGSGKTTISKKIQKELSEHSVLISQDFYYKDLAHLAHEEREKVNFDHPDSIDFELLISHIKALKKGKSVICPQYDFITHTRKKSTKKIEPTDIVILEGILIFAIPELRTLFDMKIFIDTDDDVRLLRRIERDIEDRGRDLKSIIHQYLSSVKPMHDAFVEPSKQFADIIVPQGGENEMALSLILSKLKQLN